MAQVTFVPYSPIFSRVRLIGRCDMSESLRMWTEISFKLACLRMIWITYRGLFSFPTVLSD